MDEYQEYQPVPTFSEGSYGGRGANARANDSRALASKNAIATASRAAAQSLASINTVSKNKIITSVGSLVPPNSKYSLNTNAIIAAQKKASIVLQNVKPEQIILAQPIYNERKVTLPITTTYYKQEPVVIRNTYKYIPSISDDHKKAVEIALAKKQEYLESYIAHSPVPIVRIPCKNIEYLTILSLEDIQDNIVELNKLCASLSNILKDPSKNKDVLDEFKKYKASVDMRNEIEQHKLYINRARLSKNSYFPS